MTRIRQFLSNYRVALLAWILIIILVYAGLYYSLDKNAVALAVLIVGVLGHAFAALIAWIGFLPIVGPMIAHVLSLPFFVADQRDRLCGLDHSNKARIFQRCIVPSGHHYHVAVRHYIRLRPGKIDLTHITTWSIL